MLLTKYLIEFLLVFVHLAAHVKNSTIPREK